MQALYMHEKDYAKAIHFLKQYQTKDYFIQAKVWGLIGDAFLEQGNHAQALQYYQKAITYKPNPYFTPSFLIKQARIYEAKEKYADALQCYIKIVQDFPDASEYGPALKHKNRLERMQKK